MNSRPHLRPPNAFAMAAAEIMASDVAALGAGRGKLNVLVVASRVDLSCSKKLASRGDDWPMHQKGMSSSRLLPSFGF
jgi:hypothetical protein